jgi:nitrite reductase (NADH) small subunit
MRPLVVEVNGHGILLCLQDGKVRAMNEICPHKQLSMRHGFVLGGAMVCPHHQYKFDLETGRSRRHKCQHAETFETHLEDGEVFVRKQGKLVDS